MLPADTSTWTDSDWVEMRDWLRGLLAKNKITVVFTKKDGTERTMLCTTNYEMIPQIVEESSEPKRQKKENLDTLAVYDLEKKGWRSFTVKSIKSVAFEL
jgi:ABC-type sugar transport system ATPase subunit